MRNNRVYLKTLEDLKQVDVISAPRGRWLLRPDRRLRSDSYLGVAGLVEAVRAGNVTVANALGSGLIETSAFMPFFAGLSRRMLGEELKLPMAATWWCGQPEALKYVLDNLDFLVIKAAFPSKGFEPVFGGKLGQVERSRLIARIKDSPHDFAGQELLSLSSAPVLSEDHGLAPRRVVPASSSRGAGRLLGCNSRRPRARIALHRYSHCLDAARRGKQRHLGSFRWPRRHLQLAAPARSARGITSRNCERPPQPRRGSHLLAWTICRASGTPGTHAAMYSHSSHRSIGKGGRPGVGISNEDSRVPGVPARAAHQQGA